MNPPLNYPFIHMRQLSILLISLLAALSCHAAFPPHPVLDPRIDTAIEHARMKLDASVRFLEAASEDVSIPSRRPLFPQFTANPSINPKETRPHGQWITTPADGSFWAKGAFAALLWMMVECARDTDERELWTARAKLWSEPVRHYSGNDLTVNSYAVFRRWMQAASDDTEIDAQRDAILQAARLLIEPYDRHNNTGRFFTAGGIYGYRRNTNATGERLFHAFIDHSPNTEQLLGASLLATDPDEALRMRTVAISHIRNMHKAMNGQRNPGSSGSWQRGYFDWYEDSATYGSFLMNEGKQGWSDASTWSRGQAWWLYGSALAFYHTRHPDMLVAARAAARYYIDHLPNNYPSPHTQAQLFVPPWDFDYAWQVDFDTELDSSAAAIAAAALVRLVAAMPAQDPDRDAFMNALTGTLLNLVDAPFLTAGDVAEMSIIRHGSYHHPASLEPSTAYDNGLIWGDYFFMDALLAYRSLRDNPLPPLNPTVLHIDRPSASFTWHANSGVIYQPEFSTDLVHWQDHGLPVTRSGTATVQLPQHSGYWRLRIWNRPPMQ